VSLLEVFILYSHNEMSTQNIKLLSLYLGKQDISGCEVLLFFLILSVLYVPKLQKYSLRLLILHILIKFLLGKINIDIYNYSTLQ